MDKILMVDYSKCTGCRLCEVVCSVKKNSAANPARARITVVKWESICVDTPMLCQQCQSAPCVAVCPVKAMTRDESISRIKINDDLCIGCRFCVAVCPFGAVALDYVSRKIIKCDLCDGDPTCVKFCETKALQYVDATAANTSKRRDAAERLPELIRGFVVKPKTSSYLS